MREYHRHLNKAGCANNDAGAQSHKSKDNPAVEEPHESPFATKKGDDPAREKRPPSTRSEIVIAAFTIVLTFVAVGAAVATYLQWDAARKALAFAVNSAASNARDTQNALRVSRRTARASERQAGLTAQNVLQQYEAFSDEQMPILDIADHPEGLSRYPFLDAQTSYYVWNFGWQNIGKSAAFILSEYQELSVNSSQFYRTVKHFPSEINASQTEISSALEPSALVSGSDIDAHYVIRTVIVYRDRRDRIYSKRICLETIKSHYVSFCSFEETQHFGLYQNGKPQKN